MLLTCVMAEGHAILTGMPGLGRTLIAETLGQVLGLVVRRIQFTPDLLPTDVTASEVIDCHDRVVMPGLVNAHTHMPMTLLRAMADGIEAQAAQKEAEDLPQEHHRVIRSLKDQGKLIVLYSGAHGPANALENVVEAARK